MNLSLCVYLLQLYFDIADANLLNFGTEMDGTLDTVISYFFAYNLIAEE